MEICRQYDVNDHACMTCECMAEILTIDDCYLKLTDLQKLAFYKTRLKKSSETMRMLMRPEHQLITIVLSVKTVRDVNNPEKFVHAPYVKLTNDL